MIEFIRSYNIRNEAQNNKPLYCEYIVQATTVFMDIEQLTPEQLELTLRLSDLLSMEDLSVAAAVLASFDWNIQNAIQELQNEPALNPNPAPYVPQIPPQAQGVAIDPNIYSYDLDQSEEYDDGQYNNLQYENKLIDEKKKYFEEQHASLFPLKKTLSEPGSELNSLEYHKLLAQNTKAHREDYLLTLMHKSELICKKIIESSPQNKKRYNENKRRIQNNRKFVNNLYTTYHPLINFTFGTFFLNLTRSYLEGKYLLVYIHSISPQTQQKFKSILELVLKQKQIASAVNRNCITYGMFDNSDDYQILQKYIPLKNLPAFALFKLSKSKKSEEFISSYNLSQKQPFLEWLSTSMGTVLMNKQEKGGYMEKEMELKEQYEQKMLQKQKEAEEAQAKLKEKQKYRAFTNEKEAQDYEYALIQQNYYKARQLSADEREKVNEFQANLQKKIQEAQSQIEPQSGDNTIQIKFRMPDTGQSKTRRFLLIDKISKCFDFVDCFCRDQFQDKLADFELMQTHPTLILSNYKDKTFEEVFEGSPRENVIVRQK